MFDYCQHHVSGPSGQEARGILDVDQLHLEMHNATQAVRLVFSELPSFDWLVQVCLLSQRCACMLAWMLL